MAGLLQDFQDAVIADKVASRLTVAYSEAILMHALKEDDQDALLNLLHPLRGSVAAKAVLTALLKPGHGQTLQSTLKLLGPELVRPEPVAELTDLLKADQNPSDTLDWYGGKYAVAYILAALLKRGHGQTLQATLQLMK